VGVLDVQHKVMEGLSQDDVDLLQSIANQVAIALQNADSYTRAEAALQEAQSLVNYAAEGIAILDLETELWAEPNENFARMFGMTREELAKTGPKVMSPPTQPDGRDSVEKAIEMISTAMQKGSHRFEWVHTTAQGSEFDCEIGLVRMPGDRPRLRQSILDITERKRLAELTRKRAEQQSALNLISQKIQSATTIEEAMQVAARELGHALGRRQTLVTLDPAALSSEQMGI
jgi:PAS domain S-box-containing protein